MKSILFSFLLMKIIFIEIDSNSCRLFENRLYQIKGQFPGLKEFYGLMTLLPNGNYFQTFNIANGNNELEVGFNFQSNTHQGHYKCLSGNRLKLTNIGFIYKTNQSISILEENGALSLLQYRIQFLDGTNRRGQGNIRFSFFQTGINPFNPRNQPILNGPIGNLTCEIFNSRNY